MVPRGAIDDLGPGGRGEVQRGPSDTRLTARRGPVVPPSPLKTLPVSHLSGVADSTYLTPPSTQSFIVRVPSVLRRTLCPYGHSLSVPVDAPQRTPRDVCPSLTPAPPRPHPSSAWGRRPEPRPSGSSPPGTLSREPVDGLTGWCPLFCGAAIRIRLKRGGGWAHRRRR